MIEHLCTLPDIDVKCYNNEQHDKLVYIIVYKTRTPTAETATSVSGWIRKFCSDHVPFELYIDSSSVTYMSPGALMRQAALSKQVNDDQSMMKPSRVAVVTNTLGKTMLQVFSSMIAGHPGSRTFTDIGEAWKYIANG